MKLFPERSLDHQTDMISYLINELKESIYEFNPPIKKYMGEEELFGSVGSVYQVSDPYYQLKDADNQMIVKKWIKEWGQSHQK
jgi:hypothetical protein